ncbi:MAG: hypothetical protein AAGC95_06540 [Pseudomonadota bacterium]
MKYHMRLILVGLVYFLSSAMSFANDTGYHKIDSIISWSNGITQVWLEAGAEHQCTATSFKLRYFLDIADAEDYNRKLSMIMTAYTTEGTVNLRYVCNTDNYPEITVVRWKK